MAEEVEKVNPDLVARDEEGKVYTVRYEAVNAMLLNEFLKEHRKVEEQGREGQEQKSKNQRIEDNLLSNRKLIAQQQKEIHTVAARLKEQDAKIQKVNAHVEMSKAAPRMVLDDQDWETHHR